jgi:mitogen-activated protein kinase kinase
MATPAIRKKRNWKGLNLDVSQPPPSSQPEPLPIPIASRAAPSPANAKGASAAGSKKRPPGLSLGTKGPAKAALAPAPQLDDGMLTIPAPSSAQGTGSASPFRSNYQSTLTQQLEALSLGQVALKAEDLREVGDLGSGNGGSVKKALHVPTGTLMAKKVRHISSRFVLRNDTVPLLSIAFETASVYHLEAGLPTASDRPCVGSY